MALLWFDGFDHYTTADAPGKYPFFATFNTIVAGQGRRGGGCFRVPNTTFRTRKYFTPADATCIFGVAVRVDNNATVAMQIGDATVTHVEIRINPDGSVGGYLGGSTLIGSTSATGVFNFLAGFHYLEGKITISDTVGVLQLKMNGTTVLNLTNVDTRNGGTAGWTWLGLFAQTGTNCTVDSDDLYILDGSGSENNTFLGDQRVDVQYATANGTTTNSTPSTGTNRGLTIDETAPNGDTDYNTLVATGDKDTLIVQDLVNTGAALNGVQISLYARKTDAGLGVLCPVVRHVSTDYDGAGVGLNTSYVYLNVQTMNRDAAGNVWSEATFNAMEVGYKRTA